MKSLEAEPFGGKVPETGHSKIGSSEAEQFLWGVKSPEVKHVEDKVLQNRVYPIQGPLEQNNSKVKVLQCRVPRT